MDYYISRTVTADFQEAVQAVKNALGDQGFGILTEIDVRKTLKEKLGVDFRNYVILGACNPELAYKALQAEDKIGVLLPCNVIVREDGDGRVEVAAMDPAAVMESIRNRALTKLANLVRDRLSDALNGL